MGLDVELNDCSEEQSSEKTGLEENRNKARARTTVRNRVVKEAHSACRPKDGYKTTIHVIHQGFYVTQNKNNHPPLHPSA